MIKRDVQVLVVGAGPVGLFTAVTLARKGVRVAVVDEQYRTTARSYACAIQPRTLALLEEAGVVGDLLAHGQRLDGMAFYEGGARRLEVKLTELPAKHPYLLIAPQQVLEESLERRLKALGVSVLWNHRVVDVRLDGAAVNVDLERLEKSSSGYSVQTSDWTVDKEETARVPFVLGCDGHRSRVRRALALDYAAQGEAQLFAVYEFSADAPGLREARVSVADGKVSALWPLGQGWWRFGFEVEKAEVEARREKSRLLAVVGDGTFVHLDPAGLGTLIAQRAPWFDGKTREVAWSAAIRFDRRLAASYGRGAAWCVGDAAHLAPPIGMLSMNVGMTEAESLVDEVVAALGGGAPGRLEAWGAARREEFARYLTAVPEATPAADGFAKANAKLIADCLPGAGEDRVRLLKQLGFAG